MSYPGPQRAKPYPLLDSESAVLQVRQEPQQALFTAENKEKTRKAVDPPPIVQLTVNELQGGDPSNWLVNPFLFMSVLLVEAESDDGVYKAVTGSNLLGQTVSSLHRLKDVNNKDGGFFVFGDISCRKLGKYRLQFNLFDFDKDSAQAHFVRSVVSAPFNVVTSKEFRGQMESTHLSRTFSDQGVRLRLRKEQRTIAGSKRGLDSSPAETSPSSMQYSTYGGPIQARTWSDDPPAPKRQRSDSEYGPQMHYPSHVPNPAPFQYGPNVQGNTYEMHAQYGHGLQTDSAVSFGGMLGRGNTFPHWQRHEQQGPLSAPVESSGRNPYHTSFSTPGPVQRNPQQPPQQQSQYNTPRVAGDAFSAVGGLQTPSSLPDTTFSTQQHQAYGPQSHAIPNYSGAINVEQSLTYGIAHPRDQAASQTLFELRTSAADPSLPAYRPNLPSASSSPLYEQQFQGRGVGQYQQTQDTPRQDFDPETPRAPYPSSTGAMADTGLPLQAGLLNRGFVQQYPGQQPNPLNPPPEQSLSDYKDPSYHTPQHTSAM